MATREIKTKLTLDGENQFKRAMSDAATALKTLDAEQKLAKAQFEATGDAESYATERTRILKEQIAQQEKAVEAARQALEQMKSKGVDPNSKAFQTWKTKVYNAEARLTNLNTELANAEKPLDEMTEGLDEGKSSAEGFGGALDSINKNISFQTVIDAADAVRDKIAQMAGAIIRLAKGAWDVMQGGADWADDLATRAQVDNMPVEMLQAWDYAARFIDVDTDTIVKSRSKLISQMDLSNKESAIAFNELGVAVYDSQMQYRDANDVFFDTIDALGKISNETQREAYAQTLFGKSARELLPLINAGSDVFNEYADRAPIVSADEVQQLTTLDDAFEDLQAHLDVAKYEALAALAPSFTTIAEGMTTVVAKFNEFVQSEQGQKALEGIGDAIESIFTAFSEDVDFEDLLGRVQDAIEGVTTALSWVSDNGDTVVKAIEAIAGAWGLLTVGSGALKFGKVVAGLKGLLRENGGGSPTPSGGPSNGIWNGASSHARTNAERLAQAGIEAAELAFTGTTMVQLEQAPEEITNGILERFEQVAQESERKRAEQADLDKNRLGFASAYAETFSRTNKWQLGEMMNPSGSVTAPGVGKYAGGYNRPTTDVSLFAANEPLESTYTQNIEAIVAAFEQGGQDAVDGLRQGMIDNGTSAYEASQALAEETQRGFTEPMGINSPSTVMAEYGANVAQGLANGINARASVVAAAAARLAAIVRSAVSIGLGIHSPSKVMAEMGGFTAQGFAEGIEDNVWRVNDAMGAMVAATSRRPEYGRAGAGGRTDASGGGDVRAVIVMDKEIVGEMVAPAVNGWMGAQIMEAR